MNQTFSYLSLNGICSHTFSYGVSSQCKSFSLFSSYFTKLTLPFRGYIDSSKFSFHRNVFRSIIGSCIHISQIEGVQISTRTTFLSESSVDVKYCCFYSVDSVNTMGALYIQGDSTSAIISNCYFDSCKSSNACADVYCKTLSLDISRVLSQNCQAKYQLDTLPASSMSLLSKNHQSSDISIYGMKATSVNGPIYYSMTTGTQYGTNLSDCSASFGDHYCSGIVYKEALGFNTSYTQMVKCPGNAGIAFINAQGFIKFLSVIKSSISYVIIAASGNQPGIENSFFGQNSISKLFYNLGASNSLVFSGCQFDIAQSSSYFSSGCTFSNCAFSVASLPTDAFTAYNVMSCPKPEDIHKSKAFQKQFVSITLYSALMIIS